MAFPEDPLGVLVELRAGQEWQDITGDVYTRDVLSLTGGRADESGRADASTAKLTINNRDGKYSPRNPRSPLYGLIGRNTPVRVSARAGPSHLDLDGDPSGIATTEHTPALDISQGLDVRAEISTDWHPNTPTTERVLAAKWDPAAEQRSWLLRLVGTERLRFTWQTTDGTFDASWTVQASLPLLPRRAAVRATLDVTATGTTASLYWANSLAGPWHQLGTLPSSATTAYTGTAPLTLGGHETSTTPRVPFTGSAHRVEVRTGIDGPLVAAPDFRDLPPGTTAFTDETGLEWTLEGTAVISNRNTRFEGEISSWPPRWDPSGADVWTSVDAAGILRRLGQGNKALESTLRRRVPSDPTVVAYWPLEEESEATQVYSPLPGVDPMRTEGFEFASDDSLAGSKALPRMRASAWLYASVPPPPAGTDQWRVELVYFLEKMPTELTPLWEVTTTGTWRKLRVAVQTDNVQLLGIDDDGNSTRLVHVTAPFFLGRWNRLWINVRPVSGGLDAGVWWRNIGGEARGAAYRYNGTAGYVTRLSASFGKGLEGLRIGHVAVSTDALSSVMYLADHGFSGESAWERMARLAAEESVPLGLTGDPEQTPAMGPQRPEKLLALLEQAADVDGGILGEQREGLALAYRTRASLYNQAPALVLDYAVRGELVPPLEPVDDDQRIRNDVTVTRSGGSTARVLLDEGPLSIQPPPAGVGLYDESVTLNLARDGQTEPHAGWLLHLGTTDELRYPTVTLRLERAPHLIPAVLALQAGDKIRIRNLPRWLPPGDVDLLVEGWAEELRPRGWQVALSCSPASPWTVGVIEDPSQGRVDTDGTELAAPAATDDSTLTIQATVGRAWVTAAAPVNPNPDFEHDLTGWTGAGTTLARVQTPEPAPTGGPWSMRITPDGAAQYPSAGSDMITVTPGAAYTVCGWLMSATERPVDLNVNWFAEGAAYLATSSGHSQTMPAGEWVWFEGTVTAPAAAVTANIAPTIPNYPTPAEVVWADLITLRPALAGALPSEFPFDVALGGEVVTVVGITGIGSQTMTVRRAVNGVARAHAAGTDVRLAQPAIVAL
ncbi:carbohydrate binding domain-containing protein [Streptomyces diacarni]|uniref:carbohydrate binding domain-containing protein n=1 Tax=Streptomyces diacarni TaxID=2800381 RepID=UPI0033FACC14